MCVPRFNDIHAPKARFDSWEGHPSITLNKSLQEGAITCSMRLDVMSDRALFDMCPYSDRVIAVRWIQKNQHSLTYPDDPPGLRQQTRKSNQPLTWFWFLHFNWVPLLTRSFPIPTSSSFVMDVSFCRIWSLKAFTSLLANHGAHHHLTLWKLTCHQKRDHVKRNFIFQPSVCRGYDDVSFGGVGLRNGLTS